jgi:hypothetical protein
LRNNSGRDNYLKLYCKRRENEENGVCGVNWKRNWGMVRLVNGLVGGLEVPFRAFC